MNGADAARAKEVFGAALELTGPERDVFVARACLGDEALRRLVAELLQASERPGFLDGPTLTDAEGRALSAAFAEQGPIGPYRIVRQIGEGGFGTVYLAEQEHPVRRRVALKIIKPGMDSKKIVARFAQERQSLALLDHPHIAKVLDAGATPAGRPYFAMELVPGEPITAYCSANGLQIEDRIRLMIQVCDAVQHAHGKGIIHRDLKPSNILVTPHEDGAWARVIDFGIAKATVPDPSEASFTTSLHQVMGTPEYMSPEQAGAERDIDTRSDVYSLGAVLYELLTGAPPLAREQLFGSGLGEMQRVVRDVEPPKPSTRVLTASQSGAAPARSSADSRRLASTLRGELDWIVMKAIEKERKRRYATAAELAADLRRHLDGEPVTAAPPTRTYRLRKALRRHRVAAVAASIVIAALLLGITGTSIGLARAARAASHSRTQADIAASINHLLDSILLRANRGEQGGNPDARVRDVLDEATAELDTSAARYEPRVVAAVRETIGRTYLALGLYPEAERQLREALSLRRDLLRGPDRSGVAGEIADTLRHLSVVLRAVDQLDSAEAAAREAVEIRRGLRAEDHHALAADLLALAGVLQQKRQFDDTTAALEEAAELLTAAGTGQDNLLSEILATSGEVLIAAGDGAGAAARLQRSIEALDPTGASTPERAARLRSRLAWALGQQEGRAGEALAQAREAVRRTEELLGPDHPALAAALDVLGELLQGAGDLAGAQAAIQRGLNIRLASLGERSSGVALSLSLLASVLQDMREFERAEALYLDALSIQKEVLGDRHIMVSDILNNLSTLMMDRRDLARAGEYMRQSLDVKRNTIGFRHPNTIVSLLSLAVIHARSEEYAEAAAYQREALALQRDLLGEDHPDVGRTLYNLAIYLKGIGDAPGAQAAQRDALARLQSQRGDSDPLAVSCASDLAMTLSDQAWACHLTAPAEAAALATEAEQLARHCLRIRESLRATAVSTGQSRMILGYSMLAGEAARLARLGSAAGPELLERLAEAESSLLTGYEGFSALPQDTPRNRARLAEAREWLARLYDVRDRVAPNAGHAAEAARWRGIQHP